MSSEKNMVPLGHYHIPGDKSADGDVPLFCDQFGQAMAEIRVLQPVPHSEILPIRSEEFMQRVTMHVMAKTREVPSRGWLKEFQHAMEAFARHNERRSLYNRFAWRDGENWLDMSDDAWRAIRVASSGWTVERDPPISLPPFQSSDGNI